MEGPVTGTPAPASSPAPAAPAASPSAPAAAPPAAPAHIGPIPIDPSSAQQPGTQSRYAFDIPNQIATNFGDLYTEFLQSADAVPAVAPAPPQAPAATPPPAPDPAAPPPATAEPAAAPVAEPGAEPAADPFADFADYGVEHVRPAVEFRQAWLDPDTSTEAVDTLYNNLLDANGQKFEALCERIAAYNPDLVMQTVFGEGFTAEYVANAIRAFQQQQASADPDAVDRSVSSRMYDGDEAGGDPASPEAQRIAALEQQLAEYLGREATERQRAQAAVAASATQQYHRTLDSAMESALARVDWGEFNDFKADIMSAGRTALRTGAATSKALKTALAQVRQSGSGEANEFTPFLHRALERAIAPKVEKMSRLIAASAELAELKRSMVAGQIRPQAGVTTLPDQGAAAPLAVPPPAQISNRIDSDTMWREMQGYTRGA